MSAAPDPRSRVSASRDGDFIRLVVDGEPYELQDRRCSAASATLVPRWPSSCAELGCEAHATWVYRSGDCVVWIEPADARAAFVFDGAAYDAALRSASFAPTESWLSLPELDVPTLTRERGFSAWKSLDVRSRSEELQIAIDAALLEPAREGPFVLVAPPSEAVSILDGDGEPIAWFGNDGSQWRAYLPSIFTLPSWFAGPIADGLARVLASSYSLGSPDRRSHVC